MLDSRLGCCSLVPKDNPERDRCKDSLWPSGSQLAVLEARAEVDVVAVRASPLLAQGPPGDGQPAMVELTGSWTMVNDEERLVRIDPGPELGNFTGFPLNAAGKQKALTWNSTIQAVPEHQSRAHAGTYSMRGPNPSPHIGEIIDPVTR